MVNFKIDELFPIPVFFADVDKPTLDETIKLVDDYIASDDWMQNQTTAIFHTKTTYHTHGDFLGKIGAKKLTDVIVEAGAAYMEKLKIPAPTPFILQSWLNINPPKCLHQTHKHYGAMISGTFYVKVPKDSGNFVIHDPIETRRQACIYNRVNEFNDYNYEFYSYEQPPGRLILFESWVPHTVLPNKSTEDRISISFNIGNK
jgi:uncharacterized protein (TIGR02466 family)